MHRNNREFELWLRKASNSEKLDELLWNQRTMMRAQRYELYLENRQMLDLSRVNAEVTKISDVVPALTAAYNGVIAARDKAIADLAALQADDDADQAKLDETQANLAAANTMLETLKAIAVGTPVVLPPDTGGGGQSTGGADTAVD